MYDLVLAEFGLYDLVLAKFGLYDLVLAKFGLYDLILAELGLYLGRCVVYKSIHHDKGYGRCTSIRGSSRNRGMTEKKPHFINS